MWNHFNVKVNNCQTRQYVSHRLCKYVHHDGEYIGGPENIHMPSFDSAGLARELTKIENNPDAEAEGHKLTSRMKWVQEQLKSRGFSYYDSSNMPGMDYESFATIVPFIEDFSKPAICYVAATNQFEKNEEGRCERPSSVVMALALAEQLKRTDKYKNVIILFINQHNQVNAVNTIREMAEKRYFRVPIGDFVLLNNFFGDLAYAEHHYCVTSLNALNSLLKNAGLETWDNEFEDGLIRDELDGYEYSVIEFGSCITWEAYEESDEADLKSVLGVDSQIKVCSSRTFKALYRVLWQHALSMSALYFDWGMDGQYKH